MLGLQFWRAGDWLEPGKSIKIKLAQFWRQVMESADTKDRFLKSRSEFIQQKINEGGGPVVAVVADVKIGLQKSSVSSVRGPEYDFWEPAAHEALFGSGQVVEFVYRGKKLQGIWKRADQAILPAGVHCRAQDVDMDGQRASIDATASNGDVGLAMQALAQLSASSDFQLPESAPSLHLQAGRRPAALRNEPSMLPIMDEGHAESSASGASASSPYWPMSMRSISGVIADAALEISVMCQKSQIPKFKAVQALSGKVSSVLKKFNKKDAPAEKNALIEMTNTLDVLDSIVDTEVCLNLRWPR